MRPFKIILRPVLRMGFFVHPGSIFEQSGQTCGFLEGAGEERVRRTARFSCGIELAGAASGTASRLAVARICWYVSVPEQG